MNNPVLHAAWALLDTGFAQDVRVEIDAAGNVAAITPGGSPEGAERIAGALLPGMPDLHSHAFQRSFAGLAEHAGGGDDFWSWREAMYRAGGRIGPDEMAPVAAYLGMKLLEGGYTSLVEFHYLQNAPDGCRYAAPAAMAEAIEAGAAEAGIGLTMLVCLYETGGFGGLPLAGVQQRFDCGPDEALARVQAGLARSGPELRYGLAPHSLRAVPTDRLREAVDGISRLDPAAPIHIHAAEQTAEVEACTEALGAPPVAWLLGAMPVDARWCVIHATHTSDAERWALAASGAVAGLCPSTEANLGDGIFGLGAYRDAGGAFGIGTDSNVTLDAFAELRLLEYSQRLGTRRRNLAGVKEARPGLCPGPAGGCPPGPSSVGGSGRGGHHDVAITSPPTPSRPPNKMPVWGGTPQRVQGRALAFLPPPTSHTGENLWGHAASGGGQASGRRVGQIRVGDRADFVVIEPTEEAAGLPPAFWLDAAIFAATGPAARHVMVGGRWAVRDFHHARREPITNAYRAALARLRGAA